MGSDFQFEKKTEKKKEMKNREQIKEFYNELN
jgi:hypothetical protein